MYIGRRGMRKLLFLGLILLQACVESTPENVQAAASDVTVEYDRFRDEELVRTPMYLSRKGFTDTFPVSISYRALRKAGSIKSLGLLVEKVDTDWGFYHSATGEDGYEFRFSKVDGKVDSVGGIVTVKEYFLLNISVAQLNKMSEKDYEIKVYGKRNSGVFVVSSAITKAFLQRLSSH